MKTTTWKALTNRKGHRLRQDPGEAPGLWGGLGAQKWSGESILLINSVGRASQVALVVKNPPPNARRPKRGGFDPWVRKKAWRRKRQPTPVFLAGKSTGQKGLVGCLLWGRKAVGHDLATKQQQRTVSFGLYFLRQTYMSSRMYIKLVCFSLVYLSLSV